MARLRGYIDEAVTEIQIDDTTTLPVNGGVLDIEDEKVSYTYATDKAVFGCTRGYDGTDAVEHNDGTLVEAEETVEPLYVLQEYNGTGAPIDNQTGVKIMPKGTRYTDLDTGLMYINVGDADEPTWTAFQEGDTGGASGPEGAVQLSDGAGNFANDPMFVWRASDNTLRLGVDAEGVALSITSTGGGYIYFADQDVSASTARIFQSGPTGDLVFQEEVADGDITLIAPGDINLNPVGDVLINGDPLPSAAGAAGEIQLSDGSGAFVSSSHFVFDDTLRQLRIQGETGTIRAEFRLMADDDSYIQFMDHDGVTQKAIIYAGPTLGGGTNVQASTGELNLISDTDDVNLNAPSGDVTVNDGRILMNSDGVFSRFIMTSPVVDTMSFNADQGVGFNFNASDALTTYSYFQVRGPDDGNAPVGSVDWHMNEGGVFSLIGDAFVAPQGSGKLEVVSTTQGFLPPRMTEAQRDAIVSPGAGLMVYNTDTNVLNFYNGSTWGAI